MELNEYFLGQLIEQTNETNRDGVFGPDDVRGMTITKEIIPTKADVSSTDLTGFLIIHPNEFVFNPRTHGKHIGFGFNDSDKDFIISWNNIGFRVKKEMKNIVLPEYLFLHFNRVEWDREACYRSWGSSTEVFSWNALCEMKFLVPPLFIQHKFVDIYRSLVANQKAYERGLEDLKLVCDAYIENLRRDHSSERIGKYIKSCNERNEDGKIDLFQGVTVDHVFTDPKRIAEDSDNGSVVRTGQFAFNKVMKAHNTKLPIALREGPDCVVSNSYQVFEVKDKEKLLPKYLMLWFNRPETERYAGFISFGTTRDIFTFDDLCELSIPIPDIKTQQSIVEVYSAYQIRKSILDELREKIKEICPILIRGSLQYGG